MSFRAKLFGIFCLLALLPIVGLGLFDYRQSIRALESLVSSQAAEFAGRSATELSDRWTVVEANLALLAENAEARRLYTGGTLESSGAAFLSTLWAELARQLVWVKYRDGSGKALLALGDTISAEAREYQVRRPVSDSSGRIVGELFVAARLDSLLPHDALVARVGRDGASFVVDRRTGDVLYDSRGENGESESRILKVVRPLMGGSGTTVAQRERVLTVRDGDSTRLTAVVSLAAPPMLVLATGTVEDFAGPFGAVVRSSLLVAALVAALLAVLFVVTVRRATETLSALTIAADQVRSGQLQPNLPAPRSHDEFGRLALAFQAMLDRVRATIDELERSRRLAAVGEFAAQIAHEIRNPLTGIKLNLQRLERLARQSESSAELSRPIEISLHEANRLDRVVRGVLRLGRPNLASRAPVAVDELIREVVDRNAAELAGVGVELGLETATPGVHVLGDRVLLESALDNLLTNAVEADAAAILVRTHLQEAGRLVSIEITDDGIGFAADAASRAFEPFFTTKPSGTGLGLALVQRTVEDHGGTVSLDARRNGASGATVRILLPTCAAQR